MGGQIALSGALIGAATLAAAQDVPALAMARFADHCFSPFLTAQKVTRLLDAPDVRVEFYDLDPFSSVDPSPVTGRSATPGTDRRCEVAFDGAHAQAAKQAALTALGKEGLDTPAAVPEAMERTDGTALLAARQLNPRRAAVVHVGTRPGPNGTETFMTVERLMPSEPTH